MANVSEPTGLPPELQRMTFELFPKSTLKNARLVNKHWNHAAGRALWSETAIDVESPRPLEHLLTELSGGMLNNVRKLSIVTKNWTLDKPSRKRAQSKLMELLTALPRDSLIAFHSEKFVLDRHILNILLRTQSHLTELSMHLEGEEQRGLPGAYLTRGSLTKLRYLDITISGTSSNFYRSFPEWLQHASSLQDLGIAHWTEHSFGGWTMPVPPPLLTLRTLSLWSLNFSETAAACITTAIHLPCLHSLGVYDCSNADLILKTFAKELRKPINGDLSSFSYEKKGTHDDSIAISELIESTRGLTKIALEVYEQSHLPKLSSIRVHAESLRELQLTTGIIKSTYPIRDAEYIAANFECLEWLLINIGDLELAVEHLETTERFTLSVSQEYSRVLATFARMATLKRLSLKECFLHIEDSGGAEDDSQWSWKRQWRFFQIAEELMQCLVEHGSNVDVLDLGWHDIEPESAESDENGHTWPEYSYRRGEIWAEIRGRRQCVKTTVVPVPTSKRGPWFV